MVLDRKLPIGIQDFESLRKDNYIYVDKTEYIFNLVHRGKPYFLSRPRRFGKSLFLSTLRAYFEGKKKLFTGLKIMELEGDGSDAWQKYPVFYFDFNKKNFKTDTALEEVLVEHLKEWEAIYGDEEKEAPLEERFRHLIVKAVEKTGKNAVVLVDEYDKALLESDEGRLEHNKTVFKGFFSTLKSYDHYLKFVFLTGVTKFSKVSIFSDLNQLNDISLDYDYNGICGITQSELMETFSPEIEQLAKSEGMDRKACIEELKAMYDGYHFSHDTEGVYNPFSLLNALYKKNFGMYWFATGTPTFLIEKLKASGFDAKQITKGDLYAQETVLTDYRFDTPTPSRFFIRPGTLRSKVMTKNTEAISLAIRTTK